MPKTFQDHDGKSFEVDESEVELISSEAFYLRRDKKFVMSTVITVDRGRKFKRAAAGMRDVAMELGKGRK